MDPSVLSANEPLKSLIGGISLMQHDVIHPGHAVPPQVFLAVVHNQPGAHNSAHNSAQNPAGNEEDAAEGIMLQQVYAGVVEAVQKGDIILDPKLLDHHRAASSNSLYFESPRPSEEIQPGEVHEDAVEKEPGEEVEDEDHNMAASVPSSSSSSSASFASASASSVKPPSSSPSSPILSEDEVSRIIALVEENLKRAELEEEEEQKRQLQPTVAEPSATAAPTDPLVPSLSCPICLDDVPTDESLVLSCGHQACKTCLTGYYSMQVTEGKTDLVCHEPKCKQELNTKELREILPAPLFTKFTDFSYRRALTMNPHARFCPAPDCDYAVIVKPPKKLFGFRESKCQGAKADIICGSPTCGKSFCYHCGQLSHPSLSCEENKLLLHNMDGESGGLDNVKPCPRCATPIFKLQDGSCNHMKCSACNIDFCWLCMKEINDMHFFSPSGCTFYANKPWSMKKKVVSQVVFAASAPVVIGLLAVAAVPTIMITFPMAMGKKIKKKVTGTKSRAAAMTFGITGSVLISPVLAAGAIVVGVPILLVGTYIAVPVYLVKEQSNSQKLKEMKKQLIRTIDNQSPPPTEELAG